MDEKSRNPFCVFIRANGEVNNVGFYSSIPQFVTMIMWLKENAIRFHAEFNTTKDFSIEINVVGGECYGDAFSEGNTLLKEIISVAHHVDEMEKYVEENK